MNSRIKMKIKLLSVFILWLILTPLHAQQILNDSLLITPEKTNFEKTSTCKEVFQFLNQIQKLSPNVSVFSMGTSLEGKPIPVAILANPPIKSALEAKLSHKMVIYVQGNIHAGEVEGKEALLILMRDILLGNKKHLLDSQIILFVPIYNTDANDKMAVGLRPSQENSPLETGERESSQGYDLNRDGVKMEAIETRGLFQNVITPWDPQVFVDLHTTNGTWHAYPLTWAPSYHSAGEVSVFNYSYYKMLPQITKTVKEKYDLQFSVYGDYYLEQGWPPQNFYSYNHHPRYLVNQFGFRNRMAILSEAFAHNRFYERINSTYVFVAEILEYTNSHASEICKINREADNLAMLNVKNAKSKTITKGVQFEMAPLDTIYNFRTYDYVTSIDSNGKKNLFRTGKIVTFPKVTYHAKFKATVESRVPQGYIIPAEFTDVIENLKMHGVQVSKLSKKQNYNVETFYIDSLVYDKYTFQKHKAANAFGSFKFEKKAFNKGDYLIDLNQPLANLIFYMLEPQSDDGLLHWNFFDKAINNQPTKESRKTYPVFKFY